MKDDPRRPAELIRARRALFLSSALATMACTPGGATPPEPEGPVVELPPQPATASATVEPEPPAPEPKSQLAPWKEVMAQRPPLGFAQVGDAQDRDPLESLAKRMNSLYDQLDDLWGSVPQDCGPDVEKCRPRWADLQKKAAELAGGIDGLRPLCGSYDTRTVVVLRRESHTRYLRRRLQELRAEGARAVDGLGSKARQAYDELQGHPLLMARPCLSCVAPPALDLAGQTVSFAAGSAVLDSAAQSALDDLVERLRQAPGSRVEVRGHADGREKDPKGIASERAAAAVGYLTSHGIAASRLVTLGFGASLPVAASTPEAERAGNRRVDFETL